MYFLRFEETDTYINIYKKFSGCTLLHSHYSEQNSSIMIFQRFLFDFVNKSHLLAVFSTWIFFSHLKLWASEVNLNWYFLSWPTKVLWIREVSIKLEMWDSRTVQWYFKVLKKSSDSERLNWYRCIYIYIYTYDHNGYASHK